MQREISFRPATEDDRPFLYELYADTRMAEMALVPWDGAQVRAFLTMQFDAQHTHYHTNYDHAEFLIVLVDGQPAGRLYVERRPQELQLMEITLLPAYRNAGIGSGLIKDLMAEAQATGRAVRLYVEPFNPALRLYQRLGFTRIEEMGVYWFMEWVPASD